ncbi:MAG: hypothetical protein IT532_01650 [Burkholderiales bacterium]|nr:hypothetical protein [Burkholderiales bacterium]
MRQRPETPPPVAESPQPGPPRPAAPEPPPSAANEPTTPAPPPAPVRKVSDAERLLYYYEYVSKLPAEQVAQEAERTQKFHAQNRTDFALLQLAMIRAVPSASNKDRAQALELLGSYLKDSRERGSDLRPLALLLNGMLTEQLRQDTEVQQLAAKLKEEARRNEELKQKLDALIETERKMLERNKPTRTQ